MVIGSTPIAGFFSINFSMIDNLSSPFLQMKCWIADLLCRGNLQLLINQLVINQLLINNGLEQLDLYRTNHKTEPQLTILILYIHIYIYKIYIDKKYIQKIQILIESIFLVVVL